MFIIIMYEDLIIYINQEKTFSMYAFNFMIYTDTICYLHDKYGYLI